MKPSIIRPSLAISLCILFATVFAIIVTAIMRDMIGGFDRVIIDAVQGMEAPRLTSTMQVFTALGDTKVVMLLIVAVTVFLLLGLRNRRQAYFFFFAMIGTGVLNQTMKSIIKRARPEFHRLAEAVGYSFPSGHTMMSFSFYALLTFLLWRHIRSAAGRFFLVIFSIFMFGMIAVSRIYLGVHYPSDILGGVFASAFWLTLMALLFEKIQLRRKHSLAQP